MEDEVRIKEEPIDDYEYNEENETELSANLYNIKTEINGSVREDPESEGVVCLIKTEVDGDAFEDETLPDYEHYDPVKMEPTVKLEIDHLGSVTTESRNEEVIKDNCANENSKKQTSSASLVKKRIERFQCHLCYYRASRLSHLKTHITIHTGEKPFGCHHCDYRAATKGRVKTHLRIHTEEKPHKCSQCDYRTRYMSNLKDHELTHNGEKTFFCKLCDYGTILRSKLRQHMMKHTGLRPFVCNICDFSAYCKSHLLKHVKTHSTEEPLFKYKVRDYKGTPSCCLKKPVAISLE